MTLRLRIPGRSGKRRPPTFRPLAEFTLSAAKGPGCTTCGRNRHGAPPPRFARGDTADRLTAYRLTAIPGDGLLGTGWTGVLGPRGNSSGRFANSNAVTAMTAAACFRSLATAWS